MAGRGQQHDRNPREFRPLLDLLGQGKAAHIRHVGVGQNQTERLSGVPGPHQSIQGCAPTLYQDWLHLPFGEHLFHEAAAGRVVVRYQHRQVVQVCPVP